MTDDDIPDDAPLPGSPPPGSLAAYWRRAERDAIRRATTRTTDQPPDSTTKD